jgi:ATP-binding cassette subfamily B protein RaxB
LRELTDGMLFAFVLHNHQFVDKAARLVERAIEYHMLDLHLERLADIAGADPSKGIPGRSPELQDSLMAA